MWAGLRTSNLIVIHGFAMVSEFDLTDLGSRFRVEGVEVGFDSRSSNLFARQSAHTVLDNLSCA